MKTTDACVTYYRDEVFPVLRMILKNNKEEERV